MIDTRKGRCISCLVKHYEEKLAEKRQPGPFLNNHAHDTALHPERGHTQRIDEHHRYMEGSRRRS